MVPYESISVQIKLLLQQERYFLPMERLIILYRRSIVEELDLRMEAIILVLEGDPFILHGLDSSLLDENGIHIVFEDELFIAENNFVCCLGALLAL